MKLKRLVPVFLVMVLLFTLLGVNKIRSEEKMVYDTTSPDCGYYTIEGLGSTFEIYLGYTPNITIDENNKEGTIYLRNGLTVTAPFKELGENDWWFEHRKDADKDLFRKFQSFSYGGCFTKKMENIFYSERYTKIFYDLPTSEKFIKDTLGLTVTIEKSLPDEYEFITLSVRDKTYKLSYSGDDYGYASDNGDFLINARVLSQIIYDFEFEQIKNFICLGNIFDVELYYEDDTKYYSDDVILLEIE